MNYRKIDKNKIEILPENMQIKEMLLAIAKVSYETAIPRRFGQLQPFKEASSQEACLEKHIKYEDEEPIMLLMDYIHGRDCRTKVFRGIDKKWYLDSYAFQQRKLSSEEFIQGIVKDSAEEFIKKVIESIK